MTEIKKNELLLDFLIREEDKLKRKLEDVRMRIRIVVDKLPKVDINSET